MDNIRYKLIGNNKEASFMLYPDELNKVIKAKTQNSPAVFREGIVLNWNMYSGVVEDKDNSGDREFKGSNYPPEDLRPFSGLEIENGEIREGKTKKLSDLANKKYNG